jgi:hypothetical protein
MTKPRAPLRKRSTRIPPRQETVLPLPPGGSAWARKTQRPATKTRAATAECINAQARNRGLQRLPVRGLDKVKGVATLLALAHNLMRMIALLPEWFGLGTAASATPDMAG